MSVSFEDHNFSLSQNKTQSQNKPSKGKVFRPENENLVLRRAQVSDIQKLLTLYFMIYGGKYPLTLGTDQEEMYKIITHPDCLWLVMEDKKKHQICGSAVFEVEPVYKIGRAEGFVVHPDYQNRGIASHLLNIGSDYLLEEKKSVYSIYATTRTISVGSQLVFTKNKYKPLGIFPNAHRLTNYETLTLLARHNPEALTKRIPVEEVPEDLAPILMSLDTFIKSSHPFPKLLKMVKSKPTNENNENLEFEIIKAQEYVQRKFKNTFSDPFDLFFPFHKPNLLLSSKNGEVELYGYMSESDGYCAIITGTKPFYTLAGRMRPLMQQLHDFGVSYVEILMSMDSTRSLEALLDINFLPSAIYPAMLEYHGQFMDLVLLSRSMEPLNFRDIEIEKSFKPYIDQYVNLWKKMHLEVLGVFDE